MPEALEDQVFAWCLRRSRRSVNRNIRANGFMENLRSELASDPISLRRALRALRRDGKLIFKVDLNDDPLPCGYISVCQPVLQAPVEETRWLDVLHDAGLSIPETNALKPVFKAVDGLSADEMRMLVDGLKRLRSEQLLNAGRQIFSVSAEYLLGSSKALTLLDRNALRAFGIDLNCFEVRPRYLLVGGECETPASVVFVENPVAFETAVNSEASQCCAFICTFGYGLSNAASEYGNQLASILEEGLASAIPLYRSATKQKRIADLLGCAPLLFWGDLDVEGLRIFDRIKKRLPSIRLSALYGPMVAALEDPAKRHRYVWLASKQGQRIVAPVSSETDSLLDLCKTFAVDQEIVKARDIVNLADKAFDQSKVRESSR
jgi:Uncharacterized protein conserved in bacteria C-term(DUF2220)